MRAAGEVIVFHLLLVLFHKIVEVKGLECSCHDCDPVIETTCSNNDWNPIIRFNIIASTSVLVEWDPYTLETLNSVFYDISYGSTNSDEANSIFRSGSSIILVHLEVNTNYCIIICVDEAAACCRNTFQTVIFGRQNQVMNVRAHIYKPLLSGNAISAQLVWQQLPKPIIPTTYDIRIYTADSSMEMISLCVCVWEGSFIDLPSKEPFQNIVRRTNTNNLSFPLMSDQLYIAQVRENTSSWSEPIWINTANPNPAFELFIFDEHNGSLIYEQPGVNILIQEYTYDGRTPFALDKINRNVFYTSNQLSSILKRSIDDPVMIEPFFILDNGVVPLAMTYDWIAKKLYVATRDVEQLHIYYLLDVGDIEDRDIIHVYTFETSISSDFQLEITVNPFKGLLHWTEKTTENITVLVEYDLDQMTSKVLYNDLRFPTLAENIEQSCIYIVTLRTIITILPVQIQDSTSCPLGFTFPGNLQQTNIASVSMTLDETGIYVYMEMSDDTNQLFYLYYNNETNHIGNITLSGFDTTSPGTQPLPERIECLSPNFEIQDNCPVPEITERTETSFLIMWNTPSANSDCQSVVASIPPLIYTVYVNVSGGDLIEDFPKTQYSNTLNVTGLDNSLQYTVSISARNEFTLFDFTPENLVADFRGNEVIIDLNQPSSTTTPTISFSNSITVTTSTSTTITPSGGSSGQTDIELIGGVTGAIVFILLCLIAICIVITVILCIKMKLRMSDYSKSRRYVHRQ